MASDRIRIREVLTLKPPTEGLHVQGWVRTVRRGKQMTFVEVNDGSSMTSLQATIAEPLADEEHVKTLTTGSGGGDSWAFASVAGQGPNRGVGRG